MRHRGIAIDGGVLARMHYESLNLPRVATADPFLSADDERARQASLKYQDDKGRLAAERLARRYAQSVIDLLDQLHASATGRAIIEAIQRAPMGDGVKIEPYIGDPAKPPNASASAVEPVGKPSREGEPKEALVEFTPANWQCDDELAELLKPLGIVLNDDWGPGACPDEVLLHELVHALFIVTGTSLKRRVPFQVGRYATKSRNPKHPDWRGPYEMDEFMAIMITNIYHSESGRAFIRHSHTDHAAHDISEEQFLDFGMNRAHVRLLRRKHPELFNTLNNVSASWNPLRGFRDA